MTSYIRSCLFIAAFLLLPGTLLAQDAPPSIAPTALLPLDPAVRTGVLPNGVTYFIRRNTEPAKRAEMRLAVNAGAVQEEDDQLGVAHFLEHMLFNGTRRFEKQEMINFLESAGMRFGGDLNAYTSFDETVYMLTIPTDSTNLYEKAFDVLEDWAGYATLSADEIDKERGVVIEEWRARQQNAQGRILANGLVPVYLHGTRYADRLPIGDTAIVRNAPPETIRRYYQHWYRPDLQSVVVVGDIDVDRTEALIKEHFSSLEAPSSAPTRTAIPTPAHEETIYRVVADKEYPVTSVEVVVKQASEPLTTVGAYSNKLALDLFMTMLNARLNELQRSADAPFLQASVSRGGLVRGLDIYSLRAGVEGTGIPTGLEALLTEVERVRQHGFTLTELERAKTDVLRSYADAYAERDRTRSAALAQEYVQLYLTGDAAPGISYEYGLASALLPEISLADVNEQVQDLLAPGNRGVLVVTTDQPGQDEMTDKELETLYVSLTDQIAKKTLEPYVDAVSGEALLATIPAPVELVETTQRPELGVTEITLANGVRVVMKPTTFKNDEVVFTATSPGGSSRLTDAQVYPAGVAASIVASSGVAGFTETELEKMLSGKTVSVTPYISDTDEGFNGSASTQDLETLFQLIHLYTTQPRVDADALVAFQNQQRAFLANRSAQPIAALQDTIQVALFGNHPRRRTPTVADVDALNVDETRVIYEDRFSDASDFVFTFVGAFDVPTLTTLAQTYLGTLPGARRDDTWLDVYPDLPEGVIEKTVYKGSAPQSQVLMLFHGEMEDFTAENRLALRAMTDVLSVKLREELRENRGGVYGVQAQAVTDDVPDKVYQVIIFFVCDPQRVDELTAAVREQITLLQQNGPTAEDVQKEQEQLRRTRETEAETNPFWRSTLDYYARRPAENPLSINEYGARIGALTAERIQQTAQRFLDFDRYVKVVLLPESMASPAE